MFLPARTTHQTLDKHRGQYFLPRASFNHPHTRTGTNFIMNEETTTHRRELLQVVEVRGGHEVIRQISKVPATQSAK